MSFGQLKEEYEMSQMEIAEKLFLNVQTVRSIEKQAMEKFTKALAERGVELKDVLEIYK